MESHVTLCEMRAPGTEPYMRRLMRQWFQIERVCEVCREVMSDDLAYEYAQRIDGVYRR